MLNSNYMCVCVCVCVCIYSFPKLSKKLKLFFSITWFTLALPSFWCFNHLWTFSTLCLYLSLYCRIRHNWKKKKLYSIPRMLYVIFESNLPVTIIRQSVWTFTPALCHVIHIYVCLYVVEVASFYSNTHFFKC